MIPFMWCGKRALMVAVLTFVGASVSGCKSGCDAETIQRASDFMASHQSCETDEDCVIVSDYCGELPRGFCGQLSMSRAGAVSAEWKNLDAELRDCAPDDCAVCLAAAIPTCTDGSCSAPR
jgi:hypothetical protein